jgi:hypothetical protein
MVSARGERVTAFLRKNKKRACRKKKHRTQQPWPPPLARPGRATRCVSKLNARRRDGAVGWARRACPVCAVSMGIDERARALLLLHFAVRPSHAHIHAHALTHRSAPSSASWARRPRWCSAVRCYGGKREESGRAVPARSKLPAPLTASLPPHTQQTGFGAAYGTAKSGVGIASMGVMRPELVMKSIVPVRCFE